MPPVGVYAALSGIAAVATFLAMFPARRLAWRFGFVVAPDERRIHAQPTPEIGGLPMFVAFLVAMGIASFLPPLHDLFRGSSEPLGVVVGGMVAFGVGFLDDARDMSAPAKMAGQVLAATALYFFGVTMLQFKVPFGGFIVLSNSLLPLITAVWVVAITNAVNLIDGLDGLAAGVVAIAAGTLAVYGLRLVDLGVLPADNLGPLIAAIACGVALGFLPHNLHPARAFMGDAGALFLGLLMAVATMLIGGRAPDVSGETYFFFAPLFIPLFILGVPLTDMAFAYIRRTARGTGFHHADLDHLHHRLLRLGHGPRRTVAILWAWTAVLSGFVLYPLFGKRGNAVIPFGVLVLVLALFTLLHPSRNGASDDEEGDQDPTSGRPAGGARGILPPPFWRDQPPDGKMTPVHSAAVPADRAHEPHDGGGRARSRTE